MEHLAEALILTAQYIEERPDDATADDDVKQLEGIAYILKRCTEEEKRVLVKVAHQIGLPNWPHEIGIAEDMHE